MQVVHREGQLVSPRARDDRNLPRHREIVQRESAHVDDPCLRVDGAGAGRGDYGDARDAVIRSQPDAIPVTEAEHAAILVGPRQRKSRRQRNRIGTGYRGLQLKNAWPTFGQCGHQFSEGCDGQAGLVHGYPPQIPKDLVTKYAPIIVMLVQAESCLTGKTIG